MSGVMLLLSTAIAMCIDSLHVFQKSRWLRKFCIAGHGQLIIMRTFRLKAGVAFYGHDAQEILNYSVIIPLGDRAYC